MITGGVIDNSNGDTGNSDKNHNGKGLSEEESALSEAKYRPDIL